MFALKHIYGLDDVSEIHISNAARIHNAEISKDNTEDVKKAKQFVITDWMRMSRERAFWACRRSHLLHSRFSMLFPGVELTEAAALEKLEWESTRTKAIKSRTKGAHSKPMSISKKDLDFYKGLAATLRDSLQKEIAETDENLVSGAGNLTMSKSPLADYTNNRRSILGKDDEEAVQLKRLSKMKKSSLR